MLQERVPRLAAAYAVTMMFRNASRWLYLRSDNAELSGDAWGGLADDDDPPHDHITALRQHALVPSAGGLA
jgi:hypothetical protein